MPKTDWSVWPHGYSMLLNERLMFPEDLSLWKMKIVRSHQLFVDDYLIAHMEGLERQFHAVRKLPDNPVLTGEVIPKYIFREPEGGYRLYYNVTERRADDSKAFAVRLARSPDGLDWERPTLNVCEADTAELGGGPNNVLLVGKTILGLFYEPDDADPERRWKAVVRDYTRSRERPAWPHAHSEFASLRQDAVNAVYVSPDGLRWSHKADMGLPQFARGQTWRTPMGRPLSLGDVLIVRWDPVLQKYIAHTKHAIGPDYRFPPINEQRVQALCESDDLIHWSTPRIYACPDAQDAKIQGMYGVYEADGFPYESMWLGCFSMCTYNPHPSGKGLLKENWIRLVGSRDGRHWYYLGEREPFIPLGEKGSWEGRYLRMANLHTVGGPIERDGDLWFYYRGASRTGKEPGGARPMSASERGMGIGILRKDGFASLNAGEEPGVVITRPLVFDGEGNLHVNADAQKGGYVKASVLDEDGKPIEGFGEDDCRGVCEDTTHGRIAWKAADTLAALKGRHVRLAFHLKNAGLYSFWVT